MLMEADKVTLLNRFADVACFQDLWAATRGGGHDIVVSRLVGCCGCAG